MLWFLFAAGATLAAQRHPLVDAHGNTNVTDSADAKITPMAGEVSAGETFEFTITLDKAPNFPGGNIQFVVVPPDGLGGYGQSCTEAEGPLPRQVYRCVFATPQTSVGGIWRVQRIYFAEGLTQLDLKYKPIAFKMIPNPDLIFPSSAEITINLDQRQLLRKEAGRVGERIQELKYAVSGNRLGAVTPLLQRSLRESLTALRLTETEFAKLATETGQQTNAGVFFDDLRRGYEDTISHLEKASSSLEPHLQWVSRDDPMGPEPLLALTLRPMEQNELAYKVVADDGSLTFDLEVDSTPEGATISYYRKGDAPHFNPDQTRATIPKLTYAIWKVSPRKARL